MFNWFLEEYETNIFKANERKFDTLYTWEKVICCLMIALSIFFLFISIFKPSSIVVIIILLGLIGLIIAFYILEENRKKKEFDRIVARFKKNKLEPFISMLQSEKYTMYGKTLDCEEGINWLLNSCLNEIEKYKNKPSFNVHIKNLLTTIVLPLITFIGGTLVSTLSNSEKLYYSVMILIIILLIFVLYFVIAPSINDFLTKQIKVIEDLKDNLNYYKMIKVS